MTQSLSLVMFASKWKGLNKKKAAKRKARREMDAAERSWSEERDRFEAERTQLEMEVSELVSADEHYAAICQTLEAVD